MQSRKHNYTPAKLNISYQERTQLHLPNIFLFQQSPDRKSIQVPSFQKNKILKKLDLSTNTVDLKSDRSKIIIDNLSYASRTQSGMKMNNSIKINQDAYFIVKELQYKIFGIADGHGQNGHMVSTFIKFHLPSISNYILENIKSNIGEQDEIRSSYLQTNDQLMESQIDTQLSGSTCISVHLSGDRLFCCNVGDSRAIMGRRQLMNRYIPIKLNKIHKPIGPEKERIIRCGGRVECVTVMHGRPRSPLRVWLQNENLPGLAMTRSFGDRVGTQAGIIAVPDIQEYNLTKDDHFIIVGSDGLFEYLNDEDICKIIGRNYPLQIEKAADHLMQEALKSWKHISFGRDDITFILVFRFT